MGYLRGLTHGAIAGMILGLLYAPESGIAMRRRVTRLLSQADSTVADNGAPTRAPAASPRRRSSGGAESRARRP